MLNKNTIAIYPAIFAEEDDGIVITFPDLSGCISVSDSVEAGVLRAKDALGSWPTKTSATRLPNHRLPTTSR